ncbi:MAG: glutamyl-tRNA reductase [Burkholderiales bacterium]|nr:glutamyl-tRNA reductase [Burkholderiales bacterium]
MLKPVVFGINYQTADLALRNQLAFASEDVPKVLKRLISSGIVKEALLLSTCNRTELYCITNDINFVINALCDMHEICPRTIRQHGYVYHDDKCAHHLFRVTSGLDSMVLGESEIVSQIKSAMELAEDAKSIGTTLLGLFQMALSVEKDVRNNTEINNVAVSMGHAVASYVERYLNDVSNQKILFVGAGQMMQQIAPHFNYLTFEDKLVINRSYENAKVVANKINARVGLLELLNQSVGEFAVIILCCASNQPLITESQFESLPSRLNKQLIIDLSMPMIIERNLVNDEKLRIITIDDIAKLVDVGKEERKLAALSAEKIVFDKIDDYHGWQRKRGFVPLIRQLRDQAEQLRLEALAIAEKQLQNGTSAEHVVTQLSVQLTNKLLHQPTVNLWATDDELQDDLAGLIAKLYGLES